MEYAENTNNEFTFVDRGIYVAKTGLELYFCSEKELGSAGEFLQIV